MKLTFKLNHNLLPIRISETGLSKQKKYVDKLLCASHSPTLLLKMRKIQTLCPGRAKLLDIYGYARVL